MVIDDFDLGADWDEFWELGHKAGEVSRREGCQQ